QKSQLSVSLASQAIEPSEFRVRTSGVAHDQHSRSRALKESVKETREVESFLIEIVDTAEALIGGDPRLHSDLAEGTTEGPDHKACADIDATMPDPSYHIVTDSDVGWIHRIAVPQHFNDDLPHARKLVDVMVTVEMRRRGAKFPLERIELAKKLFPDFILRQT